MSELFTPDFEFFTDRAAPRPRSFACLPQIETFEKTDGGYRLEVEVPGFSKDNLSVEVGDRKLYIDGESKDRQIGLSYSIPSDGDSIKATADLKDGLLTVEIPFIERRKLL